MATLGINETQFLFTYFHHYLTLNKPTGLSFIFPSLLEEGDPTSPNSGADLVLAGSLFLQFKMPQYLLNNNAREVRNSKLPSSYRPYFRFNIKNKRLLNVFGSGQYDLLKKQARKPNQIVKYVCPLFTVPNSHIYGRTNYWYLKFLTSAPNVALRSFVAEIDFTQFLYPNFIIGDTDEHTVCYNYIGISTGARARVFSEEKEVEMKMGVREYDNESNSLVFNFDNPTRLVESIREFKEYLHLNWEDEHLTVNDIQQAFISQYDVFWIPIQKVGSENSVETIEN